MNINFSRKRSVQDIQSSKSMLFSLILPNPIDFREEFYKLAETFPFPSVILTRSTTGAFTVSIFMPFRQKAGRIFALWAKTLPASPENKKL